MAVNLLERNSGQLSGANAPREALILPPQYAHFNARPQLVDMAGSIRDQAQYADAYQALWITYLMQIDLMVQKPLLAATRRNLPSPIADPEKPQDPPPSPIPVETRREEIAKYWKNLVEGSVYPHYAQTKSELRDSGYPVKVFNNWKSSETIIPTSMETWKSSIKEAERIFPNIRTGFFERAGLGFIGGLYEGRSSVQFKDLQDQLRTTNQPELMGYTTLLAMLNMARRYPQDKLGQQITMLENAHTGKTKLEFSSWKQRIDQLLLDLEPYYYFQNRLAHTLRDWEQANFGNDADTASTLWKSAIHLRVDSLKRRVSPTGLRRPLVELLINKDYFESTNKIEDLMAKHPGILPQFVAHRLNIDPETLSLLLQEAAEEKAAARQAKKAEPKPSLKTLARQEAQKAAETYIDKAMISADEAITLTIKRRTRIALTDDGREIESRVHFMQSNQLNLLIRGQDPNRNGIIAAEAIPDLIKKHGFTFVDPEKPTEI